MSVDGVQELTMERIKWGLRRAFSNDVLACIREASIEVYAESEGELMVADVRGFVLGQKAKPIQYPATWWEAVKERFLPEWAKRRWPVKYTVIEPAMVFPYLNHRNRELGEPRFLYQTRTD